MDRQKRRIHLIGRGCSGRAVTIQNLTPAEKDEALLTAAQQVGVEASPLKLRIAAGTEGIKMMLLEVTDDVSLRDDFRVDPKTKWHKLTRQELDGDGKYGYNQLFTAKDDGILSTIYNQASEPTAKEVEAIATNAIPLAE